MTTTTQTILKTMKILSWIVFIALLIQGGALIVAYIYSQINPETSITFVQSFDWMKLQNYSQITFFIVWFLAFVVLCLQAYTALNVIEILNEINITNPFTMTIANKLHRVSYLILAIWIVTIISNTCREIFNSKVSIGLAIEDIRFIFLAGIIFIFAQIFRRGIEFQDDHEMTI